jgi:hypothetical protein
MSITTDRLMRLEIVRFLTLFDQLFWALVPIVCASVALWLRQSQKLCHNQSVSFFRLR